MSDISLPLVLFAVSVLSLAKTGHERGWRRVAVVSSYLVMAAFCIAKLIWTIEFQAPTLLGLGISIVAVACWVFYFRKLVRAGAMRSPA